MSLVLIGRVVKPHGIRGEVVVESLSDVAGRFDPDEVVRVGAVDRRISASRPHQGRLLVAFEGVADRNQAERLRDLEISAPAVDVSDADTYFVHELVGMTVVDADGAVLGTVSDHLELPAAAGYDLLEVEGGDGGTWMLPAVEDYVAVELAPDGRERLALVDPPEGLIDQTQQET